MPHAIEWNTQHYVIDGKPGFLVSGEFHYFRVPRHDWEERLSRIFWMFNDCWPSTRSWTIVDYFLTRTPWTAGSRFSGATGSSGARASTWTGTPRFPKTTPSFEEAAKESSFAAF